MKFVPFVRGALLALSAAALLGSAGAQAPTPIPAKTFLRHPDIGDARLSPSGRWLAITTASGSTRVLLAVIDLQGSAKPSEGREYSLPVMLGDLRQDAEMLKAAAPVELAAKIRAPLLMAFGRDDRRVPIEHGTRMRDAMKAAGREPEWIVYEGEGHGWRNADNEIDFWGRVERFLGKQLK